VRFYAERYRQPLLHKLTKRAQQFGMTPVSGEPANQVA
jgi:hypothetical protein